MTIPHKLLISSAKEVEDELRKNCMPGGLHEKAANLMSALVDHSDDLYKKLSMAQGLSSLETVGIDGYQSVVSVLRNMTGRALQAESKAKELEKTSSSEINDLVTALQELVAAQHSEAGEVDRRLSLKQARLVLSKYDKKLGF